MGFCTISLEHLSANISSIFYWDSVPFLWKIHQEVYLLFLIGIVYHFPGRSVRKYDFRFLLGLCTICLEDLSESTSSVFYWDGVPIPWKIYHKVYLLFLIRILYHFYARSIRKYTFRSLFWLCTIFLEHLSEIISWISYRDCVSFL